MFVMAHLAFIPSPSLPSAISSSMCAGGVANKRPYGADKKSPSLRCNGKRRTKHHLRRNIVYRVISVPIRFIIRTSVHYILQGVPSKQDQKPRSPLGIRILHFGIKKAEDCISAAPDHPVFISKREGED